MTTPDPRKELHWLQDMREAIEKIHAHPHFGGGRRALEDDEYFRVWVFYYIERIGECASRLRQQFDYDNKYPEIDWQGTDSTCAITPAAPAKTQAIGDPASERCRRRLLTSSTFSIWMVFGTADWLRRCLNHSNQ